MQTILVIDDRDSARDYFSSLLRYRGYRVVTANNGREGLALAAEYRPELVICDVLMPVMDGYEFARQLRTHPELADTEVALCTAYFHEHEAFRLARQCGVRHVLSKPCEPDEVLALVEQLLRVRPRTPLELMPETEAPFARAHSRLFADRLVATTGDLERANQTLAGLVGLSLSLSTLRSPAALPAVLCEGVREVLKATYCAALIYIREQGAGRLYGSSGVNPPLPEESLLRADVHRRFGPIGLNEGAQWLDGSAGMPDELPPFRRALRVPIASPDRSYGWLLVADPMIAEGAEESEAQLLSSLAAHAGRIHESHCLTQRAQRQAESLQAEVATRTQLQRRSELQLTVARVLVEGEDFPATAVRLLDSLAKLLDFDGATLWDVDPHNARLRRLARSACPCTSAGDADDSDCLEPSGGLAGTCWTRAEPVWRAFTQEDGIGIDGTRIAFPIFRHTQIVGVIELCTHVARPPSQELMDAFAAVGAQLAQFLERRTQHEQILRLNRIHRVLASIGRACSRLQTGEELLAAACRIAVEQGGFALAWIVLHDPAQTEFRLAAAHAAESHRDWLALVDAGTGQFPVRIAEQALRFDTAAWSNDLLTDRRLQPGECLAALQAGMRAGIALPLQGAPSWQGVIYLYSQARAVFNESEVALLAELADDVGYALQAPGRIDAMEG